MTHQATFQEARHAHRWRIEEPKGERSPGTCKVCGAVRWFSNWFDPEPPKFGTARVKGGKKKQ